jgi:hypothetical protein
MKKPDDPVLFHAFRKENNKVTGPSDWLQIALFSVISVDEILQE